MVGEVAFIKVGFQSCGVRTVPSVTTHNDSGKACISYLLNQKRYGIKEAGVEQEICSGCHCLGCLCGEVSICSGTFTCVNDLDSACLCIFYEGILQSVGVIVILCINDSCLGSALILCKECRHLALIRVNKAGTEYSRLINGNRVVGSAGCQKQHAGFLGKLSHGKRYG